MTDRSQLRGWPIYWHEEAQEYRFEDTDEPTVGNWAKRPCGHCGLYGNSNDGGIDPCLGMLAGVTNACCGHGDTSEAYICFMGGLVIRGFDVDEFHHRQLPDEEQNLIFEHNEARRKFRRLRDEDTEAMQ